jgi:hypothetical protein
LGAAVMIPIYSAFERSGYRFAPGKRVETKSRSPVLQSEPEMPWKAG